MSVSAENPEKTPFLMWILTLIRIAGGVYDFRNFEEIQLKVAWGKNIFYARSIPHKMY